MLIAAELRLANAINLCENDGARSAREDRYYRTAANGNFTRGRSGNFQ